MSDAVLHSALDQMARLVRRYFLRLKEEGFTDPEALMLVTAWQTAMVASAKAISTQPGDLTR